MSHNGDGLLFTIVTQKSTTETKECILSTKEHFLSKCFSKYADFESK